MTKLKVLFFDIECSLAKVYTYGLYDQTISIANIIEHPRMIAFTAKWLGKRGVLAFSEYHDGREKMLEELHALLDEADVVVGWNSKRFDVKWVNSEFMVEGYPPPAPYAQIDLMLEAKKNARFLSAKLSYVSQRILDDDKIDYSMSKMWIKVDNPSTSEEDRKKEWNAMIRYAKKDTALLEPLFNELLPWIKMPHPAVESSEDALCHSCGSDNLVRKGYALTLTGKYQRFRCNDCNSWHRGTKRVSSSPIRAL